ncbi:hypothetical protein OQA88_11299 [Cercophora sp. LCS_1]
MAPMTQATQNLPAGRTVSRIKAAGLKVRTGHFTDGSASNVKAQAIASTDWRKTASATSSYLGVALNKTHGMRARQDRSSDLDTSPLCLEMKYMDGPDRRRPKDEQVEWEMIVSAPAAGNLQSSPSPSSSNHSFVDVAAFRIKDAKPMTINVNGEDLVLDGSFSFDIVPVRLDHSPKRSATKTTGYMKRIYSPASFLRMPLRDIRDLPEDVQKLLEADRSSHGDSGNNHRSESLGSGHEERKPSEHGRPDSRSSVTHGTMFGAEKARFQHMLARLQKSASKHRALSAASDIRSKDPATVASRVNDVPVTGETRFVETERYTREGDAFWRIKPQVPRQESSHDSGYSSGKSSGLSDTTIIKRPVGSLLSNTSEVADHGDSSSKRLNPAAAEFKSLFRDDQMQLLSPKKLTRTPLTNLFPEAGRGSPPKTYNGLGLRLSVPGLHQPNSNPAGEVEQAPSPQITKEKSKPAGNPQVSFASTGPTVDNFPQWDGNDLRDLWGMPMPGSLNVPPGIPAGALNNTFGTYPSPSMPLMSPFPPILPMPPMPLDLSPPMAGTNGFGSFPGTIPPVIPPLPIMGPVGITPSPYIPAGQPGAPLPAFNAPAKAGRPHFPVTQKPRDHDPIKQQQYEAYLEWRKANEPGYHMRCKMRQAQRIVRQHIQRPDEQRPNPSCKTAVEQARVKFDAIVAQEKAEKQSKAEKVVEEFRKKVRERSEQSETEAKKSYAQAAEMGTETKVQE